MWIQMRPDFYRMNLQKPTCSNNIDLSKYVIRLFCLKRLWNSPSKIIFTDKLQNPKGTNIIIYFRNTFLWFNTILFFFIEQISCVNLSILCLTGKKIVFKIDGNLCLQGVYSLIYSVSPLPLLFQVHGRTYTYTCTHIHTYWREELWVIVILAPLSKKKNQ